MAIDRAELNRCLAKAIALKNVGKDAEAADWAVRLIEGLELSQILAPHPPAWVRERM